MTQLRVSAERWPVRGRWTISRDSLTEIEVVVVELEAEGTVGRGECRPYPRYGESVADVIAQIESLRERLGRGLDRIGLQKALPPGAARNALDCAFWDLEAKTAGHRVWQLLGRSAPKPVVTAYSLSLDGPEAMGEAAAENTDRSLLKLKLGGAGDRRGDLARVEAVRTSAPRARLIVDANEGWSLDDFVELAPRLAVLGVELIEQPLPAGKDAPLAGLKRPVPVCADESCHDTTSLAGLAGCYDVVNVKLDKTGGLTEALRLEAAARAQGFAVMVGSMLSTSLALAPAVLLAQGATIADLDGPLLLERDREPGLRYERSLVHPPDPALWG